MLSNDVVQNGEHAKTSEKSGSRVQLPEHTHRYLTTDFQLEGGG